MPLLRDPAAKLGREFLCWHYPHYHRTKPYGAVRHKDWKLIEFYEEGDLELFNLAEDIGEEKNLAKEHPEKVAALKARMMELDAKIVMAARPLGELK